MPSTSRSRSRSSSSSSSSPSLTIPFPSAEARHEPLAPPPPPASSACAACKYQRRKCGSQCMLAPYFPPELQEDFQNAHRLFGVSNIVKKLRKLSPPERQKAVHSMVFEANMHAADPSGGCLRLTLELENKLRSLEEQLRYVKANLAIHTGDPHCHLDLDPHDHEQPYPYDADEVRSRSFVSNSLELEDVQPPQEQLLYHDYFCFDGKNDIHDKVGTGIRSNGNGMTYNNSYVNNHIQDIDEAGEEEPHDNDEKIRPFIHMLPISTSTNDNDNYNDNELGEDQDQQQQQLLGKNATATAAAAAADMDMPSLMQCSLGLGVSSFSSTY